jgi:hypothetical protein
MPSTEHWWLSYSTKSSSRGHETRDNFLQILVGCNCICGSRTCNFYLLAKDWTSICTTPWYAAVSPFTSSQFSIRLAAIGSPTFLLLHAWYILVWNEKQRTIMDLVLLKIYLVGEDELQYYYSDFS